LLIALYLILVIALPLTLSGVVSYRTLPRTTKCPLCGEDTLRLRSRWLNGLSRLLRHQELQSRWCAACLWEGAIRLPRQKHRAPSGQPSAPAHLERRSSIAVGPGQSGEAISLRDIEIDGLSWRVLLQCWHDADRWYGRLLFIAPTGRLWVDTVQPMSGISSREVMGKALALPDPVLAYRLRELISD
jgi:hypothetical protein